MYCMIEPLSLHIRLNIYFITKNQNRQQNKLVNMVNENDIEWLAIYIYIYDLCFLNPDVYILKIEW